MSKSLILPINDKSEIANILHLNNKSNNDENIEKHVIKNILDSGTKIENKNEKANMVSDNKHSYYAINSIEQDKFNPTNINSQINQMSNLNIPNPNSFDSRNYINKISPRDYPINNNYNIGLTNQLGHNTNNNFINNITKPSSNQNYIQNTMNNYYNNNIIPPQNINLRSSVISNQQTNQNIIPNKSPQFNNPIRKKNQDEEEYLNLMKAISDLKNNKIPNIDSKKKIDIIKTQIPINNPTNSTQINLPFTNDINTNRQNNIFSKQTILNSEANQSQSQIFKPFKSDLLPKDYNLTFITQFKLPVKYRSPEYYKLINSLKSTIKTSDKDLAENKISKTLSQLESVLFHLINIE